jgi:hypothetical protein
MSSSQFHAHSRHYQICPGRDLYKIEYNSMLIVNVPEWNGKKEILARRLT